jgi:hypothetical protein
MAITQEQATGTVVDNNREARIHVRVTEAEKRKFEKLAKKRHIDLSDIVRQLLHKEADAIESERA